MLCLAACKEWLRSKGFTAKKNPFDKKCRISKDGSTLDVYFNVMEMLIQVTALKDKVMVGCFTSVHFDWN